jgi:hypothetical protein
MLKTFAVVTVASVLVVAATSASVQPRKPPGKGLVNDLTIKASDSTTYTGTMELIIAKGKVTGTMHVQAPTEVTGKVEGTSEKGEIKLEFPYHMVQQKCDGTVRMDLKVPEKPGPITGTMEAVGCGRDPSQKLTGSVELAPTKK